MGDLVIRKLGRDEAIAQTRMLISYAFRPTPPLPSDEAWTQEMDVYTTDTFYMGVFDEHKLVASAGVITLTQNIRGRLFAGGGISAVTVHPAARRRGVAREMLTHIFRDLYERQIPTTQLYAFRESFYTRLGYTTFTQPRAVRFSPVPLYPLLKKDLGGDVELLELTENTHLYLDFLRQRQQQVHGMALFTPELEAKECQRRKVWLALARVEGQIVGAMTYKIAERKEDMKVNSFWYTTAQGRYLLLEWFARHIDHVNAIEIQLPSYERPETWWPDLNIQIKTLDTPLGRPIDVTSLSGIQCGPGQVTVALKDEYCPWNDGTYSIESDNGQLQIERTTRTADCHLSIQGLSALLYGTHDPETFPFRDWGDPTPQVQETLRSIFPPKEPFIFKEF
jgi:Predicted acetyltransferase involved in intracellular survival and related acetyltransferases